MKWTDGALKMLFKHALELSGSDTLYDEIMHDFGMSYYDGETYELTELEEVSEYFREHISAICMKENGKIYISDIYDLLEDQPEYYDEWCDIDVYSGVGSCSLPENVCGTDKIIGLIHTHPNYPVDPSTSDVEFAVREGITINGISAGGNRFMFVFGDMNNVPARRGSIESEYCFRIEVPGSDEYYSMEEFYVCPRHLIYGYEEKWFNDVSREVTKGNLDMAYYYNEDITWYKRSGVKVQLKDEFKTIKI